MKDKGPAIDTAGPMRRALKTRGHEGYLPGCGTMRMYGFGSFQPSG
jgi:hypothetical protein